MGAISRQSTVRKIWYPQQGRTQPQVYFINSNTHTVHYGFWSAINANVIGDDSSGEIVYNPNVINPNGVIGSYSFNFSFGDAYNFEETQRTYELLMANMPFLENNMNHFIGSDGEDDYNNIYVKWIYRCSI